MAKREYSATKDVNSVDHWEKPYRLSPYDNPSELIGTDFNPIEAKKKRTTYKKVNETDY